MKMSKIFTGLVVCGALMFTGALSSSAKEINLSELPKSFNYSTAYSASPKSVDSINAGRYFETYKGASFVYTMTVDRPKPQNPAIYSGTVFYKASESNPTKFLFWYEGTLSLKN
ncbi:hypothetical protein LAV73_12965 [Lysinibacillus xylanilyticus]|uniref:hypothetical protein n=1 Tax=Lysinibacillus xylanilyticus TaxID=582475 RepID=UPI002B247DE3|nr:hypothetical protein [Lysinibacillus xylanilyticus]MEB2280907.1 hypothetical protein [Lysinibacillus xylanilyticus]